MSGPQVVKSESLREERRRIVRIILRVVAFYAALVLGSWLVWKMLPLAATSVLPVRELFGLESPRVGDLSRGEIFAPIGEAGGVRALLATSALAMVAAFLLSLPVAWVYVLTRAKRGFQQSVVQSLVILPIVVAGILVLVKHSLALAFSLGAVVAAVRFRSTLDDSKDAVYIFLALGLGLASGVQIPVAMVLSALFNLIILILWYTDFGRAPAALEGNIAQRRLDAALLSANRTGMFVAKLDEEVLGSLSPDQLDALADRAWRRRKRMARKKRDTGESATVTGEMATITGERASVSAPFATLLRLHVNDPAPARATVEPILTELFPRWRYSGVVHDPDGSHWLEYGVSPPEKLAPQQALYELRTRSANLVLKAELL